MNATQVGLWAMLILFVASTIIAVVIAHAIRGGGGERVWFWRVVALVSACMAMLYLVEVFRLRSIEANLPWILAGAAVWVSMMGIAAPLDQLARLRSVHRAASEIRAAVDKAKAVNP